MSGASDQDGTTGNVRTQGQPGTGAVSKLAGLLRTLSPRSGRLAAATPAPSSGTPLSQDAPTGEPPGPARRPADTPTQSWIDVVSSFKRTINTCIIMIVFAGCTAYVAEHARAGLILNIAKGGFVVSITAASTVTVAVVVGLTRSAFSSARRRRAREKRDDDNSDGSTIEYRN